MRVYTSISISLFPPWERRECCPADWPAGKRLARKSAVPGLFEWSRWTCSKKEGVVMGTVCPPKQNSGGFPGATGTLKTQQQQQHRAAWNNHQIDGSKLINYASITMRGEREISSGPGQTHEYLRRYREILFDGIHGSNWLSEEKHSTTVSMDTIGWEDDIPNKKNTQWLECRYARKTKHTSGVCKTKKTDSLVLTTSSSSRESVKGIQKWIRVRGTTWASSQSLF